MPVLISLDAHAHIDPNHTSVEPEQVGAVLAMPLSLDEAVKVVGRDDPFIAWGVGCHPRKVAAEQVFDPDRFFELALRSPIIGEVGLDVAYQVPLEQQFSTLRVALSFAARNPRILSLHCFGTSSSSRAASCALIL